MPCMYGGVARGSGLIRIHKHTHLITYSQHVRIGPELVITQNKYPIHITKDQSHKRTKTVRKDVMKTQYQHRNKLIYI